MCLYSKVTHATNIPHERAGAVVQVPGSSNGILQCPGLARVGALRIDDLQIETYEAPASPTAKSLSKGAGTARSLWVEEALKEFN